MEAEEELRIREAGAARPRPAEVLQPEEVAEVLQPEEAAELAVARLVAAPLAEELEVELEVEVELEEVAAEP